MKTIYKQWLATPFVILILSSLSVLGNIAQAASPCDIGTSQPSYQIGEVVRLNIFRLTNPSLIEAQFFEWKLWLESPDLPVLSLVNFGSDSSLVLPAGFDIDFAALVGPVDLFTLDDVIFPRGTYVVGCRLLNPVTGEEYPTADVITFEVI